MRIFLKTLYLSLFLELFLSFHANAQILLPKFEPPTPLDSLNSEAEESMAIPFLSGNSIYFVRTYVDGTAKQRRQAQDIWSAERNNGVWGMPRNLFKQANDYGNNAVIGVSQDGEKVYLFNSIQSRRKLSKGLASITKEDDGEWGDLEKIEIEGLKIGEGYYSFYVNPDETIMMISMAPNVSTLDEDLFVSLRQADGSWGEVIHLGEIINTPNYEISPYIAEDGRTLYFSSNGHGGQGSADIFVSYRLDSTWKNWTTPLNMGPPINSYGFDAYFTIANNEEIYFSSNRDGEYSDLFYTRITRQLAFDDVITDTTVQIVETAPDENMVSGQFYMEGLPVENVTLEILNEAGEVIEVIETDETGEFSYSKLDPDKNYVIRVAAEDKSEYGAGQIYFTDDEGEKTGRFVSDEDGNYAEKGEPFNKQVFQGVYNYEELPVAQAKLVVVDGNGFPLDTITTDEYGNFTYDGLSEGEEFTLVPLETESKELENLDIVLQDENGEELESLPVTLETIKIEPMATIDVEDEESFVVQSQFVFEGEPVENLTLEIYDEEGNLLEEVETDEYGNFSYSKLDPEKNYVIKVAAEDQSEYGGGNIYMIDDDGNKTGKYVEDEEGNFAEEGEPADVETFSGVYTYNDSVVGGATLIVVDENGFPMDTITTDSEGSFKYESLHTDEKYSIVPAEVEDMSLEDIDVFISDDLGNEIERIPVTEEIIAKMPMRKMKDEGKKEAEPITVYSQFTLEGLPVENVKLEIYNEAGDLIDEVVTDPYGMFSYSKLDPDEHYIIKIAEQDTDDFSSGTVYFVDKAGNKTGRYVKGDSTSFAESVESVKKDPIQGVYSYEDKPVAKAALGVMDENGFILDTIYTDESGSFKYEDAAENENYSVVIMDSDNVKEDKLELYLTDENGTRVQDIDPKLGLMVRRPVVSLMDKTVVYSQLTLKGLPVDNVKLEIYDEKGVLVDEVYTDEFGMFSYTKLNPEENYIIKIAVEDANDYSGSRVYFVDDEGNKTGRYEKDEEEDGFIERVDDAEKEKITGVYTYEDKAQDNVALGIFDENGFLIDTVYTTNDGSFEFSGLDSNEAFSVVVMDSEEIDRDELEIFLTDGEGEKIKAEPIQEGLMVRKPMMSIVDKSIIRGQFIYQGLPVENVKLEIYSEDGVFIDEVTTDSYGTFVYTKLKWDEHYVVKIPDDDQDFFSQGRIYFTDDEGNKTGRFVETNEGEFSEAAKDDEKQKLQGKYTYNDEPVRNSGLIVVDENGVPIDTFYTDNEGQFEFFVMDEDEEIAVIPMKAKNVLLNKIDMYLTDDAGDRIKTLVVQMPKKEILQTKDAGIAKRKSETSETYAAANTNNVFIYFKFNQYILSFNDKRILDLVVDVMNSYQEATVKLIGHTDNIGSPEVNYRFGESRARSARRYLTQKGIGNDRITIESRGEENPIATNKTEEGRAKNRRVEVELN